MAIQHKNIPDNQLHEPKGIATASEGTIYTSDGAGSGSWALPKVVGQDLAVENAVLVADGEGGTEWLPEADHFANLNVERLIEGASLASSQEPSGTDTALQLEFGPAIGTAEDPVQLLVDGTVKFNTAGSYLVKIQAIYGRSGGAGVSYLYYRPLMNGAQAGPSAFAMIDNANVRIPYANSTWLTVEAGALLTFEILRDSAGNDSGGVFEGDPVPSGWLNAPSAEVIVERFTSL